MSNTISNANASNQLSQAAQVDETKAATDAQKTTQGARKGTAEDVKNVGASSTTDRPLLPVPQNSMVLSKTILEKLPSNSDKASIDMFAVMTLMHKMATENRMADREDRLSRMDEMISAMDSKVENLRKAAKKAFTAAAIQGAVQIGAGMIQIAASGIAIKSTRGSADAAQKTSSLRESASEQAQYATQFEKASGMNKLAGKAKIATNQQGQAKYHSDLAKQFSEQAENYSNLASALSAKAQSYTQIGNALGGVANGMGTIASGSATAASEMAKADAEADQGHSDVSRQQMDNMREAEQGWQDLMKDIRSQLEQQIQQDSQTRRNILQI